jgi:predicted AlkP superfamily phosphohydrolase/phosphomutase
MDIISIKKSKTTIFLLPLLYPGIQHTAILFDHFIDCYISDSKMIEPENSIIIEFDDNQARFRLPKEVVPERDLIVKSKYSNLSYKSKQQILYFWQEDETSYFHSVLYKTQKILDYWSKKADKVLYPSLEKEYWPKFNLQQETKNMGSLYNMFNFKLLENDRDPIVEQQSD